MGRVLPCPKRIEKEDVVQMYKKTLSLIIFLSLIGCSGLSYRVATCPLNKAVCSNSEMMEVKIPSKGIISTSSTFALLVKASSGRLDSLSATVIDQMRNKVVIDPSSIYRPGKHNLIDPSYWLVRFDWNILHNRGLQVEPGSPIWTVILNGKQKNETYTVIRQFRINN